MAHLRIAVVSDEGTQGGASIAATRLCVGLRAAGHVVGRVHHARFKAHPDSADEFFPLEQRALGSKVLDNLPRHEWNRRAYQQRWVDIFDETLKAFRPDAIHLHNLHNAKWDIEVVEACLRRAPVVWTMHDMWPITGSCAYSFDCRQFESACSSNCPQVGTYPTLPAPMVPGAHRRRLKLWDHARGRLALVAPSRWLTSEAEKAVAQRVPVRTIPYGLDLNVFRPAEDKKAVRRQLCWPDDDRPVLLAAAASLADKRKGIADLFEALRILGPAAGVRLVLMGAASKLELPSGVDVRVLGAVSGDPFLSIVSGAADLFVTPSHADNLPLVVQETMACGVPTVAYAVGGVPDMVRPGITGWLAAERTPQALAMALSQALSGRELWPAYAQRCRKVVEKEYPRELQVARYLDLTRALVLGEPTPSQEALGGC